MWQRLPACLVEFVGSGDVIVQLSSRFQCTLMLGQGSNVWQQMRKIKKKQ
jgi:hypothetical protein